MKKIIVLVSIMFTLSCFAQVTPDFKYYIKTSNIKRAKKHKNKVADIKAINDENVILILDSTRLAAVCTEAKTNMDALKLKLDALIKSTPDDAKAYHKLEKQYIQSRTNYETQAESVKKLARKLAKNREIIKETTKPKDKVVVGASNPKDAATVDNGVMSNEDFKFRLDSICIALACAKDKADMDVMKARLDSLLKAKSANTTAYAKLQNEYTKPNTDFATQGDALDSLKADRRFYDTLLAKSILFPIAYDFHPYLPTVFNNYFYHNTTISSLKVFDAAVSKGVGNVTTELASGFISTFRLSLLANANINSATTTTTATAADTSKKDKLNNDYMKLFNNGGQVALNVSTPLMLIKLRSSMKKENSHIVLTFNQRFSTDVLANGQVATSYKFIGQTGGSLHYDIATDDGNSLKFNFDFPFAYVYGNSYYYSYYGLHDYFMLQGSIGVAIKGLQFKAIGPLFCSYKGLQNQPFRIGVVISPG